MISIFISLSIQIFTMTSYPIKNSALNTAINLSFFFLGKSPFLFVCLKMGHFLNLLSLLIRLVLYYSKNWNFVLGEISDVSPHTMKA